MMRSKVFNTCTWLYLIVVSTTGLLLSSCDEPQQNETVNLYLFGRDSALNKSEIQSYITTLTDMLAQNQTGRLTELNHMTINVFDSKGKTKLDIEFPPFNSQSQHYDALRQKLEEAISEKSLTPNCDERVLTESLRDIMRLSTQAATSGEDEEGSGVTSVVHAVVGRLPQCHNGQSAIPKQVTSASTSSKGRLLWVVPGTRKNDDDLRRALSKHFVIESQPLRVSNYSECSSPYSSSLPTPKSEIHVVSFAKDHNEAKRLAAAIVALDPNGRCYVYCDGTTSPTIVSIPGNASAVDSIAGALFQGSVPQFSSVNYLLTSSLLRFKNVKVPPSGLRYVVAGNLPSPSRVGVSRAVLTTKTLLQLLPKAIEVHFVRVRANDELGDELKNAYEILGYRTKVAGL